MDKNKMVCMKCGDNCNVHSFAYYCPNCGYQLCGACKTTAFCPNCWPKAVEMVMVR